MALQKERLRELLFDQYILPLKLKGIMNKSNYRPSHYPAMERQWLKSDSILPTDKLIIHTLHYWMRQFKADEFTLFSTENLVCGMNLSSVLKLTLALIHSYLLLHRVHQI